MSDRTDDTERATDRRSPSLRTPRPTEGGTSIAAGTAGSAAGTADRVRHGPRDRPGDEVQREVPDRLLRAGGAAAGLAIVLITVAGGSPLTSSRLDLAFQKLTINAAAIGVGLVSAGAAYVSRERSPTN